MNEKFTKRKATRKDCKNKCKRACNQRTPLPATNNFFNICARRWYKLSAEQKEKEFFNSFSYFCQGQRMKRIN